MKRTVGETYEFDGTTYELLENHILPESDKMPLLYKLNGWALLFIVVFVGMTVLVFWGNTAVSFSVWTALLYALSFLVYVVVHELLHGIAFVLFSKQPWRTISFGVILKNGLAYCISTVPVTVRRARWSLMMPILVVCIPLYVYAVLIGSFALAILAVLFASGSVGDFYYLWQLRHTESNRYMMEEMPTKRGYEIGYYIYRKL